MNATKTPFCLKVLLSAAAIGCLAVASPSESALIDFDQEAIPVGGTVSFDGTTVTGEDIAFDRIIGFDTPFNDGGSLTCTACTLSFETGALTSTSSGGGVTNYTFGAGGFVSVDGQVQADPGGTPPHPGSIGNIVLGEFTSASLIVGPGSTFTFLSNRGIIDIKDTALVEYFFGIGANDPEPMEFRANTTELGGTGEIAPDGTFTTTNLQLADFNNTPVPEPGTALLFLLGLSGVAVHARRRR